MTKDMPKTITCKLEYPVEHGGEKITELTFRRRKAKDLCAMDLVKGATRQHMAMLASMADTSLPVIENLDADDYDEIAEATLPLLGKSVVKAAAMMAENPEK